ncbi:hypothetical protein DH2020_035602 [Rehmannia glutinosa]|uniref:ABC1 atypical kinase-like domain-containing protein n=1 Tax=Rehmannia glutinosa TaxID=99300 RepID=A0ABR0V726_REHGL
MLLVPPPSPPLFLAANFTPSRHFRPSILPRRRLSTPVAASNEVDSFTQSSGYLFELSSSEAESLTEYNISKIAAIYQKKPLILLRRLFQTATTLGKWFALRYYDRVTERTDVMFEVRAAELRKILAQLGPAYIKIAQAISSRPDLIPPSYLDELSLLQDRIAPFSTEVAFDTIEQELGLPIDALFSEISPEPVAAASLGQVYQARLRSSGKVVAIKVQRPGVRAAISLDILILRYLAGVIRRAGKFNTDLQSVVDEWASSLFREMDYKREADNGVKFRQLYGNIQDVVVPEMYVEQTTRKVLTMQWIEGQKLAEVKDLYMIEVGVYCSFNQLLECGFYHADPHPGNLLRTYDGKLAYLDFGMMGEFKQELRDGFIEACLHLVNRDYDALAKDFVTLGLLPATADKDAVTEALTGVFRNAVSKGIRNISFGDLLGNLGTTMYKFKFRIPSYFSLVIRRWFCISFVVYCITCTYTAVLNYVPSSYSNILIEESKGLKPSILANHYVPGQRECWLQSRQNGELKLNNIMSLLVMGLTHFQERLLPYGLASGQEMLPLLSVIAEVRTKHQAFRSLEILIDSQQHSLLWTIIFCRFGSGLINLELKLLPILVTQNCSMPISIAKRSIIDTRIGRRQLLMIMQRRQKSVAYYSNILQARFKCSISRSQLTCKQLSSWQFILLAISIIIEFFLDSQFQFFLLKIEFVKHLFYRSCCRTKKIIGIQAMII